MIDVQANPGTLQGGSSRCRRGTSKALFKRGQILNSVNTVRIGIVQALYGPYTYCKCIVLALQVLYTPYKCCKGLLQGYLAHKKTPTS